MDLNDRGQADGAENDQDENPQLPHSNIVGSPASLGSGTNDESLLHSQEIEDTIVAMGFSRDEAKMAVVQTGGISVELAIAWVCENRDTNSVGTNSTLEDEYPEYKMVFVVNTSLPMSVGKICAQVAHAAIELYQKITEDDELEGPVLQWLENGSKKISLKAESTEELINLGQKANEAGLHTSVIEDAGLTQIPSGSRTVCGIFGQVTKVDEITGRLKLL